MLPQSSAKALAAWDELCRDFAGDGGADADWLDPLDPETWMIPLSVSTRVLNPTGLLFFTKQHPAYWVGTHWKRAVPKNTAVLVRHGVATATYAALVRREARRARCRVRFVGDLDPEDLAIYLSLAYGDYRLRPRPDTAVPIEYVGITDRWLDAAEHALGGAWGGFPECISIPMTETERRFLGVLEQVGPPLESWVGPRCAALLRSGSKIELEGVLNPDPYPPTYARALARLLRGARPDRRPRRS